MPILLGLAWPAAAAAHPFGGVTPGHDIALVVDADALRLRYAAALPTHDVLAELREAGADEPGAEAAAAAFTEDKLDALLFGLGGRVNDAPPRWTRAPAEEPTGRGDSKLVRFEQEAVHAVDGALGVVTLSNGNAPDQRSYYRWTVDVGASLEVLSCSLVDVEDGAVVETRYGQWRMDEPQRELSLRVRPRRLVFMAPLLGETDAPRPVHEALYRSPTASLRRGAMSRELGLMALVALGGAGLGRAGRARWAVDGAALLGGAAGLLLAPPLAAVGLFVYAGLGLLTRRVVDRWPGRGALGLVASCVWAAILLACALR